MKTKRITIVSLALAGLLVACGAKMSDEKQSSVDNAAPSSLGYNSTPAEGPMGNAMEAERADFSSDRLAMADSISSMMSSSAAVGAPTRDTSDKFIITANARFRVQEVRTATFATEKIVAHHGGYVAHTDLQSTVNRVTDTPVSDDSSLVTTFYTVSNTLVLRVPAEHLDSTLRELGKMALYLDYRSIDRQNVKLQILRERLEARRANRSIDRLEDATDATNGKLRDRAAIDQAIYDRETAADESHLRTLEIQDQIALSTITITMYQREAWTQELVARAKSVEAYGPGFWERAGDAIASGWNGFLSFLIGLLHLWPGLLVIALIAGIIIYSVRRGSRKS